MKWFLIEMVLTFLFAILLAFIMYLAYLADLFDVKVFVTVILALTFFKGFNEWIRV
jgi:hypothetical protein